MAVCTYDGMLQEAAARFGVMSSSSSLDARLLMEHAAQRDHMHFLTHGAEQVDSVTRERFLACVERRVAGEPIAYITGRVGFYGRAFVVTPDVLVPRPETEHLVEAVLEELKMRRENGLRIADIGTGSGALAVTLACELPHHAVYATEVSSAALSVARQNAERLGARVVFLEGDLAAPLSAFAPFSCVVANLPYIKSVEMPRLPLSVRYEPRVALDGGADGLQLYGRLAAQLSSLLTRDASLFFEAAPDTIDPLAALVEDLFPQAHVEIGVDYAGLERYVGVYFTIR
jgi:release factor glutamine methyltransferase